MARLLKSRGKKQIKLAHHHAKPYRKRHIGLIVISVLAIVLLANFTIQYSLQVISGQKSSADFVRDLFTVNKDYTATISSTLGYSLHYDQKQFYASGIDATSGDLFLGSDVSTSRAYGIVRLAPTITGSRSSQSSLSVNFHNGITYPTNTAPAGTDIEAMAFVDNQTTQASFSKTATQALKISGNDFTKSIWALKAGDGLISQIRSEVVVYTGVVSHHPVTIVINYGLGGSTTGSIYDKVIDSLSFGTPTAVVAPQSSAVLSRIDSQRSVLDLALGVQPAAAATNVAATSGSEKVSALYGPAVVKIYNAYCMDIVIDGASYLTDACSAWTGSGFFVSQDGYIATNGHVASTNVKDIVIEDAITYAAKGNTKYLTYLLNKTSLVPSSVAGKTAAETRTMIVDALYALKDSRFVESKGAHNMLVALKDKVPDVTAWIAATKNRTSYSPESSIEKAEVVATDYRSVDGPSWGASAYKASDVALIKIGGSNYPLAKLGSIDNASQGANLMILGYPGDASNNGLVDETSSTVTLTTGKVSSIKNASGSDKKLIETDTTIGHGNSGGPALVDDGGVVGIATYTIDGSGSGNGVFNYIRDIKDLQDLATSKQVTIGGTSKTQTEWQKGLDSFYTAHYSSALKNFTTVQSLYPDHPRVQSFISTANKRIANGEDIKDFPVLLVAIVGIIVLAGAGTGVLLVIRHKKRHDIYKAGIAQGVVQSTIPGAPVQVVTVDAAVPTVNPVAEYPIVTQATTSILSPEVASVAPVFAPAPIAMATPIAPVFPVDPTPLQVPIAPIAPIAPAPQAPVVTANQWFDSSNTLDESQQPGAPKL